MCEMSTDDNWHVMQNAM